MKFAEYIERERKRHAFLRFDSFIMEKMGYTYGGDEGAEKLRHQAFREFRQRTGRQDFASMPTMRRWFGMNGKYRRPSREHVYEMCFAMKLDREETEEYLTRGLGEPSFQINDYQELIFLYGIENKRTFEECIRMAQRFEKNLDVDYTTSKTHSTRELQKQFEINKHMESNDFLLWMIDRAEWFKGYSQTALTYLETYKNNIIKGIREEEKKRLNDLLREAGYEKWCSEREDIVHPNTRESIEKFVKNYDSSFFYNVSESMGNIIMELAKDVYSDKFTNIRLLSEVFAPGETENEENEVIERIPNDSVKTMSEKYLSDLFHMPEHRELSIRIAQARRKLSELSEDEPCPEWGKTLIADIVPEPLHVETVAEGKQILDKAYQDNGRRCLTVQRGDLLPLIHTAAQQQYFKEHAGDYQKDIAKKMFCEMANTTLNACNMMELSEEYELDTILLACYADKEMYSFNDVLSVYSKRGGGQ